MATVPQVLRLALNEELTDYGTDQDHNKIKAIVFVRAEGYVEGFDGAFNGVSIDATAFGAKCNCTQPINDEPVTPGHVWVYTPQDPGPSSEAVCLVHPMGAHWHCPDGCSTTHKMVGMKEAKDYVEGLAERYFDRLDPGKRVALFKQRADRLQDSLADAEREVRTLRLDLENLRGEYGVATDRRRRFEQRLLEESTSARVTERRLGKALSQVAGLKAKVADRDARLRWMADANKSLLQQVRRLNGAIAQDFVRRAMESGLYDGD